MDVKQAFRQKVNSLMKEIRVAMMSTRHGDSIFSRPMAMQDTEFEGTLYFLTSKKTGKCDDLQTYPKVNLAFSHPGKNNYVSLSGVAELVDDRDKIADLWKTFDTAYFPKGPEDPDVTLIKVDAESVEYWDSPSSSIVQAYRMVKTALTGEWDATGEHERQRLTKAEPGKAA